MNNFDQLRKRVTSNVQQSVLTRWDAQLVAAEAEDSDNTISIYEPIGYDWWTGEGMTAKRMSGILRHIGNDKDIVVNINSPGGDVFEGLAIYNLLKAHGGHVTVNVIGLAASAASFIAMAADTVKVAKAGFLMIHNAWLVVAGDRNDLAEVSEWLLQFDETLAGIYADKTGTDQAEIMAMMDAETWLSGAQAIEQGFADAHLDSDVEKDDTKQAKNSMYRLDAALAQAGMPRAERRAILKEITAMPGASEDMPRAVKPEQPVNLLADLTLNL